ncbi:uncharacterized protein LAESUDRAFT_702284 [Laetiporus sulphureus 93-53]|uniref:Uncharacterized protein n=1 Tax=Laetiporus sulphureus 93-53 TaxID=1314785 RepID=A0A165DR11_9APHY|nr:uncharacterized protein LAESUDRAFT_702284 [Laetiporus sulphureus 93-53]KZT05442.1 hypothetical protein LAESUDRAFT_702284 [Laetiporus sulphureus 93-53]
MFQSIVLLVVAVLLSVTSYPVLRRDVDSSLVPDFGVTAGIKANGSASCDGIDGTNGEPILIPCQCPPDLDTFIEELNKNVAAGYVINNPSVSITFPEDNSTASQITRINACLVTLQNLNGTGVGCPASATTWVALQKEIAAEGSSSSSSVSAASTATGTSTIASTATATSVSTSAASAATSSVAAAASSTSSHHHHKSSSAIDSASSSTISVGATAAALTGSNTTATASSDASTGSCSIVYVTVTVTDASAASATSDAVSSTLAASRTVSDSASSSALVSSSFSVSVTSAASATATATSSNVTSNESLVPDFGVTADTNPNGSGSCDGIDNASGEPILIPCSCPPSRDSFIAELSANVAAGHVLNNPSVALTFPTDNSTASQLARIDACLVTLQNLIGTGVGCPAAATTWGALQIQLTDEL